jgi:pyruvate kinase
MVRNGTMNLQNGIWVCIKKGKIKMENKEVKKYMVMSKFKGQDRFMLEKQFINRHSADYYATLMTEEKDYKDIEYFLFEQSVAYNNKDNVDDDVIPV